MKKILFTLIIALGSVLGASAQKFALVDMDYILSSIPNYEMANEQLNQLSQRWQKEVEAVAKEAETMYKNYQNEMVFLTDDQKRSARPTSWPRKKRGRAASEILRPRRRALQKTPDTHAPHTGGRIQRHQKVSEERGYQCIFDRASSADIIFASPRIDVSNEVLEKLGYSK